MTYLPKLLEILKDRTYIPLPVERLAEKLKISKDDFPAFKKEMGQHLRSGTLIKLKKNRICLPRDADLVTGVIRFRQSGAGTLIPDPVEGSPPREPLQIMAEDTAVSMHGDRVVCRIQHDRRKWKERRRKEAAGSSQPEPQYGRVIRILERAREKLTGTLKRSRMFYYVIPDDPRIIQDILVPDPEKSGITPVPQIDDKVLVNLAPWEQRHLNPEGEIIEVLGKTHTPFAEYQAILHSYNLNPEFPAPVLKETEKLPDKIPARDRKGRLDIRKLFVVTIDPQDAKDFDDALSYEDNKDGTCRIGIHIADVSAYVRPGTALDREARERSNSTYLVGKVIPMLPHELSNGLCSLVEDEERLTKSVFITCDSKAKILKTEFSNTVIRSSKRLTYEQAFALLTEKNIDKIRALPVPPKHQTGSTGRALAELSDKEIKQLADTIQKLWGIAKQLRTSRVSQGSLELDMPESKIYVDAEGWADRIVKIEYDESHQLIEEFMLAANESVARSLNDRNLPAIHRVHDKPDAAKLDDLSDYLETVGIQAGDLSSRKNLNQVLRKIREHPQSHILRIQFLRSLKQACYRSTPDGHFGLAKKHYLHFTSPIRRYADLLVHRIFDRYLAENPVNKGEINYSASELASLAQHISIQEQNSTEAERESIKVKLMEFFERELTKKKRSAFKAAIMDIRNHGMFVELTESMAYGLIHISTLTDDLYKVSPDHTQLIGRRTRKTYSIGETIDVSVHRVDRFKRQIDFTVASGKKASTTAAKPEKAQPTQREEAQPVQQEAKPAKPVRKKKAPRAEKPAALPPPSPKKRTAPRSKRNRRR